MQERSKIVNFYLEKVSEKGFEISDVRKDLERNNFEEEEIRMIVRLVDEEMQAQLLTAANTNRATTLIYAGVVTILIGLVFVIGPSLRVQSRVIDYSILVMGTGLLFTGLAKRQSPYKRSKNIINAKSRRKRLKI